MARYTGPVCRLCRRQGEKLFLKGERCFTPKCAIERRNYPPGSHISRRRRISEWGIHLKEKQKARFIYSVMERQMRLHFAKAQRRPGATGENLLQILETRLDNVVFRLGFADSRRQSRQLVRHGHLMVNGHKTDIPSFIVKAGDTISWTQRGIKTEFYKVRIKEVQGKAVPEWLSLDQQAMEGRVLNLPQRADMERKIEDRLIVEFYSR